MTLRGLFRRNDNPIGIEYSLQESILNNNISVKTNNHISENPINKPKIKNEVPFDIADPTKVTKTPKKDYENQIRQELFNYNPDSVFDKFIKSLQNSPILYEEVKKLLLSKQFVNNNIKNDPVLSVFFDSFLSNIKMNDTEILDFLKFQQGTYTKFQGEFFDMLRTLISNNPDNKGLQRVLKNFLRSYDCFVSVKEINSSINATFKNIEKNIPEMLKTPFNELTGKFIYDNTNAMDLNLELLKNEILPFIGRYVSKMNDFGIIRDYVSVLVHNLVRLEYGSKINFSDELESLFEYLKYNFRFDEKQMELLKTSLISTYETKSNIKNNSIESFLKLLDKGVSDSENAVTKGLMRDMTESLLFSQNVNIPLLHMFLPLNYKGMFMFSEIWIDKDDDSSDNKGNYEYHKSYKVFITFDIQDLGYFETTLKLKDSELSLDIYIPGSLSGFTDKIKSDLDFLLSKNNVIIESITVQECVKARRFSEVFTNLTERKNGVDVTI